MSQDQLRQAAQAALDALEDFNVQCTKQSLFVPAEIDTAIDALRAALAADKTENVMTRFSRINQEMENTAEPVAWVGLTESEIFDEWGNCQPINHGFPERYAYAIEAALKAKNAAPPLRDLGVKDILEVHRRFFDDEETVIAFARAIIAAAREVK